MLRRFGTTTTGASFTDAVIEAVWSKGRPDPPHPLTTRRRDVCGASTQRYAYGTEGLYGWEIDHIKPTALWGADDLANLQLLHGENNQKKQTASMVVPVII